MNEWIDLMEGHTAWHRLLKYSQNQRFTTQLESMEGSQCESIGLYLSNNATTLSIEHHASVCEITLSLRTILTKKEFIGSMRKTWENYQSEELLTFGGDPISDTDSGYLSTSITAAK